MIGRVFVCETGELVGRGLNVRMFSEPHRLKTKIYASLPDELRLVEKTSTWAKGQPVHRRLHSLLEGPCITPAGQFFCVDVAHGRIFEIDNGEMRTVVDYDGEPNGLRYHSSGAIFVADYKNGLMKFDPVTYRLTHEVDRYRAEGFRGVNDLCFSPNGDLYFTDQGLTGLHDPSGRVFRRTADGNLEVVLENIPSPNGLVFNRDGSELYVGVTRDNSIWRIPILRDGSVTKVGRFIQMSGGTGPDGLGIDSAGNLLAAHVGLGCVWIFSPRGEPIARVDSCAGFDTTNLILHPADPSRLFITEAEAGVILAADLAPIAKHLADQVGNRR